MKKLVIDEMRDQHAMSEADAGRAFDAVFSSISTVLGRGERVAVQGFGTFRRELQPAREARNPATGETVNVPERHVTKFKEARQRKR